MAEVILMPRLSDTMTEGVIAAWHKKVGDSVKKGDLLAEVETDKATMDLESYKEGTLLHIGVDDGGKLQVDDLLAIVGEEGENIDDLLKKHGGNGAKAEKSDEEKEPKKEDSKEKDSDKKDTGNNAPEDKKEDKKAEKEKPAKEEGDSLDISKLPEVILMPRLSDTMTEGVIAGWHKQVGDTVKKGDVLADIETDKATMELESYKDGELLHQGAKEGEKIAVNELLAIVGEKDKVDLDKILAAASSGSGAPEEEKSTTKEDSKEEDQEADDDSSEEVSNESDGSRIKVSPLAKKLAAEKGINLKDVKGSGDNNRIVKKDIDNYVPSKKAETQAGKAVPAALEAGKESFEEVNVSQMRKVIAKRLGESKFTAPHFYLTMAINMDKAVASRAKLNEVSPVKISFNDMVLKACALALKKHPKVNSSWRGEKIRVNHHVHIGVAVAVEEGLLVPVVRFADSKPLSTIATEVREYAQKAKDKKLQPSDWEGNTFTISNLGMFGIDEFTAIINTPDACILAIGAISEVPIVKNGQIVVGNIMKVTLSCDHRVVDGASGAAFLQTLQELLEEPLRMLI